VLCWGCVSINTNVKRGKSIWIPTIQQEPHQTAVLRLQQVVTAAQVVALLGPPQQIIHQQVVVQVTAVPLQVATRLHQQLSL
jgi:hypothetical protein